MPDERPTKLVLEVETAEEVVDLIRDRPGDADEDRLDQALEAIDEAGPRIPADDQERIAQGDAVAVELDAEAVEALGTLIEDDRETRRKKLKRLGQRLQGKLKQARKRRR